jgi:hypothetical protein
MDISKLFNTICNLDHYLSLRDTFMGNADDLVGQVHSYLGPKQC